MMRLLIAMFTISILLVACKDEENGLTDTEKANVLLTKQWDISSVMLEEIDITDFGYTLSKIQFNPDGTWTAINGGDIFASSGNWNFSTESFDTLNMSGADVEISLNEQGLNLELRFTLAGSTPIGGRTSSTSGDYIVFLLPSYPN